MEHLAELLKEHYSSHPALEVRDAIKFLYQSYMGPGHILDNEALSLARLKDEWEQLEGDPALPLSISLGNGLCRLDLRACKGLSLSPDTVHALSVRAARGFSPDPAGLREALTLLPTLPFPAEAVDRALTDYLSQGCPAVHHSDAYCAAYSPAYRVVFQHDVGRIPLLAAIDQLLSVRRPLRVGIDGPCASGKSMLGAFLAELYRCPLIHMDDFFLQPQDRTPERLAQPGGNVDALRFDREVLTPLCQGKPVRYRPWLCRSASFGPERTLPPAPLTIVEGSYSLRPDLRDRYSLRVWIEAPWEVRRQRLLDRGGPDVLARFQSLWIPLEDRYFSLCRVKECCHIQCDGQ